MKVVPHLLIVLIALAVPFSAQAAKKKGKGEQPPAATPIPLPGASNPAEALSPYIVNLQQLLALDRPPGSEKQPLFTQTTGLLTTLRQQLMVELTKAPPEQKGLHQDPLRVFKSPLQGIRSGIPFLTLSIDTVTIMPRLDWARLSGAGKDGTG